MRSPFLALLILAATAFAQLPDPSKLPTCPRRPTECKTFLNVTCVCTSKAFQDAAGTCLTANCTPDEQQTAKDTQTAACGGGSATATGSNSASHSGSQSAGASASGTGSSSTPAATGTQPAGSALGLGAQSILAAFVAAIGVAVSL
ncbi:hypothetical protein BKA62DRAFT_721554 [Auriculariales sp. MPI-PUGE-AT-0066]|nr:hypothetical protein BKA62DRAFT_721554 [Auriculariales sp. MPI-PUGE-AT-0066]